MKRNGTDGGRRAGGSITVYLALTLAVMVSLILASITSVKIRAGRMQAANAMDQAMYSLFAKYDRQLDETYALFFLDAGRRTRRTICSGPTGDVVCSAAGTFST